MKPICKYCKYVRSLGFTTKVCNKTKHIDCTGDLLYTKCSYKNKDFQCIDFESKVFHRWKYNSADVRDE